MIWGVATDDTLKMIGLKARLIDGHKHKPREMLAVSRVNGPQKMPVDIVELSHGVSQQTTYDL